MTSLNVYHPLANNFVREEFYDALSEIVCVIDPEGVFQYLNKAVESILGYTADEMIGRPCYDFMVKSDISTSQEAVVETANGNTVPTLVNRYRHKNGSIVYIEWTGNYVPSQDCFFSIGKDVTEQKRLSEYKRLYDKKLKFTNKQMEALLEQISDALVQTDAQLVVSYCNRQSEKLLGRDRNECIGMSLRDCTLISQYPDVAARLDRCLQKQKPDTFEYYFPVLSSLIRISFIPSRQGVSVFMKDISIHKSADLGNRLAVLGQFSKQAIILTDARQHIIWVNDGFTNITGYTLEEAIGHRPCDLLQGVATDRKQAGEIAEKLLRHEPVEATIQSHRKCGKPYWSEVSIQPIFNNDGQLLHFLSVESDMTAQKEMEGKMERYRSMMWHEVEEAVDAAQKKERQELAEELHDNVNQVLTTVKLYMEMVLQDKFDKTDMLPRAMQHVQTCIDELRSISKRLTTSTLHHTQPLGNAIAELAETINATEKLNLSYSLEKFVYEPLPPALRNAAWKSIQEQVNNIMKYAETDLAHIRMWKDDGQIFLSIKDHGKGFDPATKVEGIGLKNMHKRVAELGGVLAIETSPGKGCEVLMSFPDYED